MRDQDSPVKVYSAGDLINLGEQFSHLVPAARLAVLGDPIAQSASPPMQNTALRERNIPIQYVRIHVSSQELPLAFKSLVKAGFIGANLTMPHKQAALPLLDQIDPKAMLMGGVNTVSVHENRLVGFNTDGPGLESAIMEEFGLQLKDCNILVLGGAGGAGRAITVQCFLKGAHPVIANRLKSKGDSLLTEISNSKLGIKADLSKSISMSDVELRHAVENSQIIINATPLGMREDDSSPLPDGILTKSHYSFDTVYAGRTTRLVRQAEYAGAHSANGLSMLLHQGALSFEIWFGQPAPLELMRKALLRFTT